LAGFVGPLTTVGFGRNQLNAKTPATPEHDKRPNRKRRSYQQPTFLPAIFSVGGRLSQGRTTLQLTANPSGRELRHSAGGAAHADCTGGGTLAQRLELRRW
jgi:hypothetical protein